MTIKIHDEASSDFTMAISLHPRLESAYQNRGNDYLRKALYDLSVADFSKVIGLDSRNVSSDYNRAVAYQHLGRYDDTIIDLPNFRLVQLLAVALPDF